MKARFIVLIMMIACSLNGNASSRSQRASGATIFNSSGCSHCHSIRGTGGKKGPDLSGVGRRLKKERMRKQIVDGSNRMPPFGDDLQEKEIRNLIAYLRSCRDK
jgi:ubiquinol-cytochrome c reductase cytochrome b subunit